MNRSRLPHHRETVGEHAVPGVARAHAADTVAETIARLAREHPACAELVCVVDESGRFAGALPISRLFAAAPQKPVAEVMEAAFPRVSPEWDQEHAASLALHRGVNALPVVDPRGMLVGVMPTQALLHVLRREHTAARPRRSKRRSGTATCAGSPRSARRCRAPRCSRC